MTAPPVRRPTPGGTATARWREGRPDRPPGAPGDECLEAVVQSVADHGEDEIIYACDAGACESALSESTEEDVVDNEVDLRHEDRQGDREGHLENLAGCYF